MKFFLNLSLLCLVINVQSSKAQLYINEVMPANDDTFADNAGEFDDWFEVYNASNNPINLAGYYFTDDLSNNTKWLVPSTDASKTTVSAKGYKIFWADEDEPQGEDHLNFKLDDAGDAIYIFKPDTTIEDGFTFPALSVDQSYGRNTDGDALLLSFSQSTPGTANLGGIPLVAKPVISPGSGVYSGNQLISINSATPAANIYYTTNGSEPTTNSNFYNGPFSVGSSVSIRAIAVKPGYSNSEISTESFVYYDTGLPIVSISTKPDNLWNNTSGIYIVGTNGIDGNCMNAPANFNQKWERPANIIMLETDGSVAFNTNAGISVSGGCSRRNPQKSFNIAAKSVYGSTNFKHQIFPGYEQDKFKRFKLRNGGNEFNGLHMRDVITQSLIEGEVDIDQQRSRAAVVFINGDYWGIMNIRDSYSEHWIKENHKIADKDSIDLLEPNGGNKRARVIEGSESDYVSLYEYIEANNLSNQNHYNYVKSKIDINEYINYWIIQLYMANTDWPGNNLKIWREQLTDAKFRWLLYDTDWTLGYTRNWSNSTTQGDASKNMLTFATNTANSGWPNDNNSTLIFRKLLQNTAFKNEFIQRFATQMEIIFEKDRCQAIADERYNEIIEEKQAHFDRWKDELKAGTSSIMSNLNMNNWQSEFDYARNWFAERRQHVESHIQSYFNIGGTYILNIPVNASTNGSVLLNENEYKAPFNYSGKYFDNIPVRIRAVASPGYRFSNWEENGSDNEVQIITTSSDKTRTPVFEPAKELVINEIFYNPEGSSEGTEFLEIYNPDSKSKSLNGYYFDDGICFQFPEGATIDAGEYVVLAKYASVYEGNGYQVFQWKDSSLSNDGELLVFKNPANEVLDSVRYNDNADWAQAADGDGYSLALLDYNLNNETPTSWNRQIDNHRITPGAVNIFCTSIEANAVIANISCNGAADGFISVNPSGGTAPFTYAWSNGSTAQTITNLDAGNYTVSIKDALLCEQIENINITEPTALQLTVSLTNESYFQGNDGAATASVAGGVEPYTYNWSNGGNAAYISNLAPGNYSVVITDAAGCTVNETVIIEAIDCSTFNVTLNKTDESSFQANNGSAIASVTGGVEPYIYNWSNGSNTSNISSLAPGIYSVEVVDATGCSISETVGIEAIDCSTFNVTLNKTDESSFQANNGSAIASVTGGVEPYIYNWSNGSNTASIFSIAPGIYSVEVKDVVGCTLNETITIEALPCDEIEVIVEMKSISCEGETDGMLIIKDIQNGTLPYSVLWSTGITGTVNNNLASGSYSLNIIDRNGCEFNENYVVNDPIPLSLSYNITNASSDTINDGEIDLTVEGGARPYTFYWSNGSTNEDIDNLTATEYWVTVTDKNDCSQTLTNILVEVNDCVPSISQTNNPTINSGKVQAKDFILSNAKLNAGKQVVFKAGKYIELSNEFEVPKTTDFEALIETCE